jgi:hypothetical protein
MKLSLSEYVQSCESSPRELLLITEAILGILKSPVPKFPLRYIYGMKFDDALL